MAAEITIIATISDTVEDIMIKSVSNSFLRFPIVSYDSKNIEFEVVSFDREQKPFLKKGALIQVIGDFSIGVKKDSNNNERTVLRVLADRISLIQESNEEDLAKRNQTDEMQDESQSDADADVI